VRRFCVTSSPVSPGGRLHQQPVFVAQVDRQAVELQLGVVVDRRRILGQFQFAPHARVEGLSAGCRGVSLGADRKHRHRVPHWREAGQHRPAHALRRRIGGAQARVDLLQRLQLAEQAVVLRIRDLRRVEHVIAVGMLAELVAQLGGTFGGWGRSGHVRHCRPDACKPCPPAPTQLQRQETP
jgi:hypothetical protein